MLSFRDRADATVPLLLPTVFELDTEHYSQAQTMQAPSSNELAEWQSHLSALGLLAFEEWLTETVPHQSPVRLPQSTGPIRYLTLNGFRLCIITTEECLSDCATLPDQVIHDPAWTAHFYILLEVAEEQAEVIFRGLIRHDRLTQFASTSGDITLPLSAFEPECRRLLHYCRYLEPSAIPLPVAQGNIAQASTVAQTLSDSLITTSNQLSQWFDNIVAEGWQTIEALTQQPQLAATTRGLADGIKRGKLLNLGLDVGEQSVALVLTITPEADEKISILIQLLPTGSDRILPPALSLSLVSRSAKVLQSATSRDRDNYIQLKSFRGNVGQQFSVVVKLGEVSISESFEI